MFRIRTLGLVCLLSAAACGSRSPLAPTDNLRPAWFAVTAQRVTMTANEVVFEWTPTSARYRVTIGTAPNSSDLKSADVTTPSYTFVAPRTANTYYARVVAVQEDRTSSPTVEVVVTTIDLRNVIDALYFRAGPMSVGRAQQLGSIPAGAWPDGTHVQAAVTPEGGEHIRALTQDAMDAYAAIVGGAVTGTAVVVDDDFHWLSAAEQLPPFTIVLRIAKGQCGLTASGCTNFGPAPLGPNAAIIALDSATVTSTVAHEMLHAYGLGHVVRPDSDRPEFRFLMNPVGGSTLTEVERNAIGAAYAGGIRAGTTRDQALARGLVLPYSGPGS